MEGETDGGKKCWREDGRLNNFV